MSNFDGSLPLLHGPPWRSAAAEELVTLLRVYVCKFPEIGRLFVRCCTEYRLMQTSHLSRLLYYAYLALLYF